MRGELADRLHDTPLLTRFRRLVQAFFSAADGALEDVIAENIREDYELLQAAESSGEYTTGKTKNQQAQAEPA